MYNAEHLKFSIILSPLEGWLGWPDACKLGQIVQNLPVKDIKTKQMLVTIESFLFLTNVSSCTTPASTIQLPTPQQVLFYGY